MFISDLDGSEADQNRVHGHFRGGLQTWRWIAWRSSISFDSASKGMLIFANFFLDNYSFSIKKLTAFLEGFAENQWTCDEERQFTLV